MNKDPDHKTGISKGDKYNVKKVLFSGLTLF